MLEGGARAPEPDVPSPVAADRPAASAGHDPAWADALVAARLFACAPDALGGIHVVARAGPVRDRWLAHLQTLLPEAMPRRRITPNVPAGRLTGGIDVAATLAAGRPVHEAGLLEAVAGGCLTVAMAERFPPDLAGIVARALDEGGRFGVVALDEGEDDEDHAVPGAITDRLGLRVRLDGIPIRHAVTGDDRWTAPDAEAAATVVVPDALAETIVAVAAMLRGHSMRAPAQAMVATRLLAALDGRTSADEHDVATALRLTCGAMLQAPPEDRGEQDRQDESEPDPAPPERPDRPDSEAETDREDDQPAFDPEMLQDMLIAAAKGTRLDLAALNETAITRTRAQAAAGKAGAVRKGARRGRPAGLVARPPYPDARPNVVATLRTAAPWQPIRRKARGLPPWSRGEPLEIRPDDFRYVRYAHNTESTAIFAVDASGSTALERLGEAKGCVELLLAECYVRRDQVALVAFRGEGAEVLLEPTRSLVRAKRSLTALPGGGPTPLAAGLKQAVELAERARRRGQSPLIVVLTDGKGNVALDGTQDRAAARSNAEDVARQARIVGARSVIIDIARRPRAAASTLAEAMGADYVTLPRADARAMSDVVTSYLKEG
ncbi:MAG: magnesium chelatase subunit D [Roseitalea porphyridii]|uniref:magnesium chelatase subunit D n=1 Tax=Roseitalea porphyridii TaxID=1852022 RepID=UPI0032D925AC